MKFCKIVSIISVLAVTFFASQAVAETGTALSNTFIINNRDAIKLNVTNNWDGTVTVSWEPEGNYVLSRLNLGNSELDSHTVHGSKFIDHFSLSELSCHYSYSYILANAEEVPVSEQSEAITPEVIIVLVRGYDAFGIGIDDYYWHSDVFQQEMGLVFSVQSWFETRGITCWDASLILNGTKSIEWNAGRLNQFIKTKFQSDDKYNNAKVNLFGHSMGGLISRQYAYDHQDRVLKIFCAQTPHTGSPLSEFNPKKDNEATQCLATDYLESFNQRIKCDLPIYATYSKKNQNVLHTLSLTASGALLYAKSGMSHYSENDGAVPYNSAKGVILGWYYDRKNDKLEKKHEYQAVDICSFYNSGLDHYSCFRHPNVLNKIIEWLDISSSTSTSSIEPLALSTTDTEEETSQNTCFIGSDSGIFDSSSPVEYQFSIATCETLKVFAYASDTAAINLLNLSAPDGTVYTPETSDSSVTYSASDDGYFNYTITNPQSGPWTASFSTDSEDKQNYGITVFDDETISMTIYSDQWANVNDNITVYASVSDNDTAITDVEIIADITYPDQTTTQYTLTDDGTGSDSAAGDGVFMLDFADTTQIGTYYVTLTANAADGSFQRTAFDSFTISSANINISGGMSDSAIDSDNDGIYESLQVTIPVDISEPTDFMVIGNLTDSSGNIIDTDGSEVVTFESVSGDFNGDKEVNLIDFALLANFWGEIHCLVEDYPCNAYDLDESGTVDLADLDAIAQNWMAGTGQITVTLEFSSEKIFDNATDGPFTITDIQVLDPNAGTVISDTDDYTTTAYTAADFAATDTDGDGLADHLEIVLGTSVDETDTDSDGATDYEEVAFDGTISYNSQTDSNPLVSDTDGDTISDGYEIACGMNPLIDDSLGDLDGDGLTNLYEYENHLRADKADTDEDGTNDGTEVSDGTNPAVYGE